jgi:type I pullulanase
MKTTNKIVSALLAVCMLGSTSAITSFAATEEGSGAVSSDNRLDTPYSAACQNIDDQYAYNGNDLGATYSKESTTFKVWSPTATKIVLNLYATGSDDEEGAANLGNYELEKLMDGDDWTGIWTVTVSGDIKNVYYTYSVTAVPTTGGDEVTNETQDVYSVATGVNGNRSMVCDLDSTDPEGWENDNHVLLDNSTESSVWEIHIKDFSYDPASGVSEENQGKYLAFTEEGTTLNGEEGNVSTCIDYLKELGITTVQINPFYDFQSVDETGDDSQFNWGYDPQNYNVPEGSFSSNAYDGNVRITECKEMIQALHNAGISVVMDVVYNHTYNTDSCFQNTVPNYYYRMDANNEFTNGSGCGNETATERAMFRNYMIQSCLYWVNEYHIDGFRFDLMGIMDVETMNLVRDALDTVDTRITTWGEGWSGGDSYHPTTTCTGETFYPALQSNASKLNSRIAFFNDGIRDGIKGGAMSISNQGFVQGTATSAAPVVCGIRANTVSRYNWKSTAPEQTVSYDSCHDNATLYDQIIASTGLASYGERSTEAVKMNKLAAAILYTSQGINFTLAGEEMCRTKYGDTNSYKSAAEINMIQWQNVVDYADVISYYRGFNEIRKNFSTFTVNDNSCKNNYVMNQSGNAFTNTIAFTVTNTVEGEWNKLGIIYNSSPSESTITFKDTDVTADTQWVIVADGDTAGLESLGEITGNTITVPARTAYVLVDKDSFDSTNLESNTGKVKINFVYENDGSALTDTVTLNGNVGAAYQTSPSPAVPDTYVLSYVKGNTKGNFTEDTQEVTYYYTDYTPESIKNADINNDGVVNVLDVSLMQKYLIDIENLSDEQLAKFDLNYDGVNDILDVSMLQKYLVGIPVSTGTVVTNYYYTDEDGNLKKLRTSDTVTGRVGSEFSTETYEVVGYSLDKSKLPSVTEGKIPYGATFEVNYYYTASSLDIKLHFMHNGSETWNPYIWVWGSDRNGVDTYNFTQSGVWSGDEIKDTDGDGWYDYNFTYKGSGTYNIIISTDKNGSYQTNDYKGASANEMWVVIDDSAVSTGAYLTFYLDNPVTNPSAPIAESVYAA